jgi:hypothetical protein
MLTNKDSNLKVLVAIPPNETVKDDVQNVFLTKHIIPFLRKVELNIQSLLMKQFILSSFLIKPLTFVITEQR